MHPQIVSALILFWMLTLNNTRVDIVTIHTRQIDLGRERSAPLL